MVRIWIIVALVDLTGKSHESNSDVLITAFQNCLKELIIDLGQSQKFDAPNFVNGSLEGFCDFRCYLRFKIRLTQACPPPDYSRSITPSRNFVPAVLSSGFTSGKALVENNDCREEERDEH